VRPRDRALAQQLESGLLRFSRERRDLPGIADPEARQPLIEQFLESIHRVNYPKLISTRDISPRRADPTSELFDPLKAAISHQRKGNTDEALWLVFLFVHFGKHSLGGYRYAREIYGRLGQGGLWDWESVSADPSGFRTWLAGNVAKLRRAGVPGGFGNHRKYESLNADANTGTGAAVESYVRWVNPPRTHEELMGEALKHANGDARRAFDRLYNSMKAVTRFGRTAKFDYLAMVGKLGLAPIDPGSTYMQGATGPVEGARLLFGGQKNAPLHTKVLDQWLVELERELGVGMQVMEDALCNWQKSPRKFKSFRG
jgi:hypothetical protein